MAIAVMGDMPAEVYDAINEAAFGTTRPTEQIEGLVIHTVTEGPNGFSIFDVWESREAFETFINDRIVPAMKEAGMPTDEGEQPEIRDLVHLVVNQETRV